jgi:hypothetical protein
MNTAPDVCLTQVGLSVVPVPYPNTAKSSDLQNGSKTVKIEGHSAAINGCCYSKSTGDEAGNRKGMISGTVGDKAEFLNCSFDIKCEGKGVCRNADLMTMNNRNTIGMNWDSSAEPPAPKNPPPPKDTVRIKVVEHLDWDGWDEKNQTFYLGQAENKTISGMTFKIKLPDGSIVEKTTDKDGIIELTGQDPHGRFEIIHVPEGAKFNSRHFLTARGLTPLKRSL